MPKYKIGIFGSSEGKGISEETIVSKAKMLGRQLAQNKCIVISGAGKGLPNFAITEAFEAGAEVWGFSPALSKADHERTYSKNDIKVFIKLFFTPKNFIFSNNLEAARKYRNVVSTATCDAGIIISGMWGTLNEFTNLHDMGKVIGVLLGTGGIADELPKLLKKIHKPRNAIIIFDKSPKKLVEKVIKELEKRK